MKDSYSFDINDEGLEASYAAHRDAYLRIFDRLGFDYVIVKATVRRHGRLDVRGVPGQGRGRRGHLRALLATATTPPTSRPCRCAAPAPVAYDDGPRRTPSRHPTPRPSRPWSLSTRVPPRRPALAAGDTLKNVLVVLKHADGTTEPLAIGLPGDREVDQKRLEGQLEPVEVEPMDEAEMRKHPTLVKGYIGPGALGEQSDVRHPVPRRPPGRPRAPAGSPAPTTPGSHVLDLVAGRDFTPDGTIEAAEVRDGDPCPTAATGTLETARGIEIGHIFQLGRKYAEALDLQVLDENGKPVTSPWAPTASASPARSPRSPRTPTTSWTVLAARGRPRRRARGRDGQGRGGLRRRPTWRHELAEGSTCSSTTGRRSSRGQVQGRRADRRPHDRGGGQGLADGRSRSRTGVPASARRQRERGRGSDRDAGGGTCREPSSGRGQRG